MSDATFTPVVIESLIKRKGGSFVLTSDRTEYHFAPNAKDRHVAVVRDAGHASEFLRISEGYRLVGTLPAPAPAAPAAPAAVVVAPAPAPEPTPAPAADSLTAITPAEFGLPSEPPADWPNSDAAAPPAETGLPDLVGMSIEQLRAVFTAETGQPFNPRWNTANIISQINSQRIERNGAKA